MDGVVGSESLRSLESRWCVEVNGGGKENELCKDSSSLRGVVGSSLRGSASRVNGEFNSVVEVNEEENKKV